MLELLSDPSVWVGFFALITIEIVLGIDNLVFIAILANKLPPHQRDKARTIGLALALLMRLGLLSVMSWLITLTKPLFSIGSFSPSLRDLILIVGGFFLVFKATLELHEKMEGKPHFENSNPVYAGFAAVVVQIVILDAVFSLDAVITAVGMVKHLEVMMAAVIISMLIMLVASKPLTRFVGAHPTVVVLCLSFLLMIGFSLIVEGLGFHIPKGYLYAAIGFAIVIEAFNQWSQRNQNRNAQQIPLRDRTADAILRMMGGQQQEAADDLLGEAASSTPADQPFAQEERYMISGVLTLSERDVQTIMTPRLEISWVNLNDSPQTIRQQLLESPHSLFPVCRGSIDRILGVVRAKDMLAALDQPNQIAPLLRRQQPVYVSDDIDNLKLMNLLKNARGNLAIVLDEYGQVLGLVTPLDIFEAIAGEFPDEDETPEIIRQDDHWLVEGTASLYHLRLELNQPDLLDEEDFLTVGGMLSAALGGQAQPGAEVVRDGMRFEILRTSGNRVLLVRVTDSDPEAEQAGQRVPS